MNIAKIFQTMAAHFERMNYGSEMGKAHGILLSFSIVNEIQYFDLGLVDLLQKLLFHELMQATDWAGKRLPTEEEWQFIAQGFDGMLMTTTGLAYSKVLPIIGWWFHLVRARRATTFY